MNYELFIAKRIHFSKDMEKKVSPPAIRIAILGVSLGLAVMILSVSIVIGFKKEIRAKLIGFGSHIQISNFDSNTTFETKPIALSDSLMQVFKTEPGLKHVERFATKPGLIKTDTDFMGIALKGIGSEYNWYFFKTNMIDGDVLQINDSTTSNDVIISKFIADKLGLKTGDSFLTYFYQDNLKIRKFKVKGIYQTNFTEYDKLFIVSDIKHVQRLSGWDPDQVSGVELMLANYNDMDRVADDIYFKLMGKTDRNGAKYYSRSIKELNPQIFSWLDLLDMNVWVILILMSLVAGFTMISGLLIIILERTNMIGVLKALGDSNTGIRKIFLYVAFFLVGKGLLWGNIIGVSFCLIQKYFKIIKLDPEVYYISSVPIDMNFGYLILLNIGAMVISMLMLIGPSYLVAKISPAKSIRFE